MAREEEINEGSTAYLDVDFIDKDGNPSAPAAITYQIDDADTGAAVKADTPIGVPAASIEITLTPADNAILVSTNEVERRRVTVKASFGGSDGHNSEYIYTVLNLAKIS